MSKERETTCKMVSSHKIVYKTHRGRHFAVEKRQVECVKIAEDRIVKPSAMCAAAGL